jgi:hypothetical protein
MNKSGKRTKLEIPIRRRTQSLGIRGKHQSGKRRRVVRMLGTNILDLKTTLRRCLILGVIAKDVLVPLADAEAALDEFEKKLSGNYAS